MSKICPSCGRTADLLIHNVQDWSQFCPACAPPSFSIHSMLTLEDLEFMKACGVDPGLPEVLRRIVELAKKSNG